MAEQSSKAQTSVLVDAIKLSRGLKTTFAGIAMIFDSLGALDNLRATVETTATESVKQAVEQAEKSSADKDSVSKDSASKARSTLSTLTFDDLTKIIVQKIEKNRANNERIQQILNNKFSVAKVKELAQDRYEEFVNDIAEL